FEAAHKSRFGFIDDSKELVVEAVSVEAVGGGGKFTEPGLAAKRAALPSPPRPAQVYSRGPRPRAGGVTPENTFPPTPLTRPAHQSPSSGIRPSRSRTAGAPKSLPRTTSCWIGSCRSSGKAPSAPPPTR